MANAKEIGIVMNQLARYYEREIPDIAQKVYIKNLADLPSNVLQAAADYHISKSQWFPKVNELREAAKHVNHNGSQERRWYQDELGVLWSQRVGSFSEHPVDCPCLICAGEMIEAQAMELCYGHAEAVL